MSELGEVILMRDLIQLTIDCIKELKAIEIPIQNDRIREIKFARLSSEDAGICTMYTNNTFRIKISLFFKNEKIDINELRETICHELLHTCPNCYQHTGKWIEYAKKIDATYGYEIVAYKTDFDLKNKHIPVIHRLRCPECEGYWNIRKKCDWKKIQNGAKYTCVWCGSCYETEY